jgi:sulfite reductase beta subunit-like hemoprotein
MIDILKNFPIGKVVQEKDRMGQNLRSANVPTYQRLGHVVGFARNTSSYPETILLVQWDDGNRSNIHPNNVFTE